MLSRYMDEGKVARLMIEYMPTLLLLSLLISVVFLIRLILQMPESIDSKTDVIGSELKDITGILDELCDMANDALNAVANSPITQTASSPMESILNGLISSVMTPKSHGIPQENQWPIQEINENPPEETTHQD